ncbi:helix-turn-helix domain-containing protein [Streptomyces europaeiscabiei]|uniref:helix-turn-helix domain-containing protein n=1 Tax=Streptomyces europaeiscabiei TaxID=146819 RepID=UPI0038F7B865
MPSSSSGMPNLEVAVAVLLASPTNSAANRAWGIPLSPRWPPTTPSTARTSPWPVLAWLDAVGNVAEDATRLGAHTNTLRYRLRRTAELFDISLDDPDDRLSLWLQLRLMDR